MWCKKMLNKMCVNPILLVMNISVTLMFIWFVVPTYAILIENGDGTVNQTRIDGSQLMWTQNALLFGADFWPTAVELVDQLIFAGYDDWRFPHFSQPDPNCSEQNYLGTGADLGFNCTGSEMGNMYYLELGNVADNGNCSLGIDCGPVQTSPFTNLGFGVYWSDTEMSWNSNVVFGFNFGNGNQVGLDKQFNRGDPQFFWIWPVRDVSPTSVPEPGTVFLFGSGLIVLVAWRIKTKKRVA